MTSDLGFLRRRTTAAVAVGTALTVVAGAPGVGLACAATNAKAPCTKRALEAGLRASSLRGHVQGKTWGCAGRFAYAGVVVDDNEVTVLFRVHGREWQVVSRAEYCNRRKVPARIYKPACESN